MVTQNFLLLKEHFKIYLDNEVHVYVGIPSEVFNFHPKCSSDRKLVNALTPSNFIAGRPKAALLFWFFGDFRYSVLLFMVVLVICTYKRVKIYVKC